jgi:23S rRNA pseudouridine1911/1915/1917 synthase
MHRELRVRPESAGQRLDRWLCVSHPSLGRAEARRLIDAGQVQVNGRRAAPGARLASGDRVELSEQAEAAVMRTGPVAARAEPELPLRVCYEDAHLVVVDKPAGMPCHPLREGERGTLAGALLARYPEMAEVGYARAEPGLVHRLDTDTSGLVLAARDPVTFAALRTALEREAIDKRYVALCIGLPPVPSEQRAWLLARGPRVRVRRDPFADAVEIRSELLAATTRGAYSLVHVRVHRARRHQIRAHLAALGHAIAGDERYGGPVLPGLARHFLHASEIALRHPHHNTPLQLQAELAPELSAVWRALPSICAEK